MNRARLRRERIALAAAGAVLAVFLALPLVALFVRTSPGDLLEGLRHPLAWPALALSLQTTTASLALLVLTGTPLAWVLATSHSRAARAVETLVQLPVVIPPAVAGLALLLAFGRRGVLSGWLYPEGWSVAFTMAAVVLAEVFVSAPFYVQAATAAFRRVDPGVTAVARSLGATPLAVFARVVVPMAAPGLAAGAAMAWARALGEFGATLMFAGNLRGRTQTLPLAIYSAMESDLRAAQALSVLIVIVAFALLLVVRSLAARENEGAS